MRVDGRGGKSYNQSGGEEEEIGSAGGDTFIWDDDVMIWWYLNLNRHEMCNQKY
jgi:hypothetical protein